MKASVEAYVGYIDVDVELTDFRTEDLAAELARRQQGPNGTPGLNTEERHPLHDIFYSLKSGQSDRAIELTRQYVCDELGVVL
ncbi:hypothetical protein ACHMW6_06200 [Pseudoduganella sp. UC29_106]|uniref:hypothetical protein n=1 Tax=Pseudoduganella sp. UC29_106 TaxID=3374553 RepID=UPI003757D5BE